MNVTVTAVVADHGTIVVFGGVTDEGRQVHFGVDHRPAQGLADALAEGPVDAVIEPYQILGVAA